jgi:phage-related minor tail protein
MTDSRKVQLGTELDATGVRQGAEEVKQVVRGMAQDVKTSAAQAGQAVSGIGTGAAGSAEKVDAATKSLIGSVQRATAALNAGSKGTADYFDAIAKVRGASADALKPYLDQLRAAEAAQSAATGGLGKMEISAKQTAAALRGVPAQFTDIVTALQGGQKPLTVLLQQGGQLKDMFGGVGAAAQALGGYVVGLINPFTLAAVAVGAVAYGMQKGSEEGEAFRRTLILTGNAAGVTADQLAGMAASVSKIAGGTQGNAASVLNSIAGSAKVGADNLQRFTAAAIALERAGGPAASETAKAFEDLARSPVEASKKLNDATVYLTASVYAQIKALSDQGRTVDAARVAQEAYAAALEQRTPLMVQNLGLVEKAWRAVKDVGSGAIDALLNFGRQQTPDQHLSDLAQAIANAQAKLDKLKQQSGTDGSGISKTAVQAQENILQNLKQQEVSIQRQNALEAFRAKEAADVAVQTKAANQWLDDQNQYLSRAEQLQLALTKAKNEGLSAGKSEVEIAKRLAVISQQFDPGVNLQNIANAQQAAMEKVLQAQLRLDNERQTGFLNEQVYIEKNTALAVRAIDVRIAAAQQELALAKSRQNSERDVAALQGQIADLAQQRANAEQKGANESANAYFRLAQSILLVNLAARQQSDDEIDREESARLERVQQLTLALYDEGRALDDEANRVRLEATLIGKTTEQRAIALKQFQIEIDLRKKLDAIDRSTDFSDDSAREAARQKAIENAAKQSSQAAAQVAVDTWQRAADDISSSLTGAFEQAFTQGGHLATNLRDAIKSLFAKLVLTPTINAIFTSSVGSIGSLFSSGASAATGGAGSSIGALGSLSSIGSAIGGLSTLGSFATTGFINTIAGTGLGSGLTAAGSLISGGSIGSGIGLGLGALGPYALAAAALYALFSNHSKFSLGSSASGTIGAGGLLGSIGQSPFNFGNNTNKDSPAALQQLISGLGSTIFGAAASFGGSATGLNVTAATDLDRHNQESAILALLKNGSIVAGVQTGSGAFGAGNPAVAASKQSADTIAKFFQDNMPILVVQGLQQSDLPKRFHDFFNEVSASTLTADQANKILANASAAQKLTDAFGALGGVFSQLNVLSVDADTALLGLFGGIDQFTQATNAYLSDFYTDSERAALTTQQLAKSFGDLGLQLPATRDAYRALVDAQDLNTESGRKAYASLIQLAPAFASVVGATQDLADGATSAADQITAAQKALADLASKSSDLQIALLKAQGDTAGAAAAQRQSDLAKLLAGITGPDAAAITAAYDYNIALQQQVDALNAASQAAAQHAQAVTNEAASLQQQLLQLTGSTDDIRAAQIAALDPSNQALQAQIFALQDQKAAADAAAQALSSFNGILGDLQGTNFDLTNQLLGLQGNTDEVAVRTRQADLAKLTAGLDAASAAQVVAAYDANVAIQQQIDALNAQQAAAAAAAQALASFNGILGDLDKTNFDLTNQLLTAQGNTAEVARRTRERDLASLTAGLDADQAAQVTAAYDANTALQQQIDAQQQANQAAQDAAQAADALRQSWQSLTTSIVDEVNKIRGLISSGGSPTADFATAQAKFATATAQARAGDQSAAQLLPSLAETLLTLAGSQATSLTDLKRIQAQTAQSLNDTLGALAGSFGITIPKLATGTDYVPSDMVALLHQGEAVVPKAYNPANSTGAYSVWASMADEMRALRSDLRAQASATVRLQKQVADVLKAWDADGMPQDRVET